MAADPPTPTEALSVLARAAYEYKGTRSDHEVIAQAVQVLTAHLNPPDEPASNGQTARVEQHSG